MITTALWIIAILLSVFALEQLYQDTRQLDMPFEHMEKSEPDHYRAIAVAVFIVGVVWAFGFGVAALIGFVYA